MSDQSEQRIKELEEALAEAESEISELRSQLQSWQDAAQYPKD